MIILDGRKIRDEILAEIKKEVATLSFQPVFCDVLVGEDPASAQYVQMKAKMAEVVGFKFHKANFPESISPEELITEVAKLNDIENICGLIIQLPLPKKFEKQQVLDAVAPGIDVDCLGNLASTKFYENDNPIGFPTALACTELLNSVKLDLVNKKIVVLGQGLLVGKPVAHLLKKRGLNPIIITRNTPARNAYGIAVAGGENKTELIKKADVIISGMGHGKFLTGDMIKKGVVLIDAGTSESNGAIVGDVDLESVQDVAGYVSPVPGGVGPVTVAMLLKNVLNVAKNKKYE